MDSFRRLVRSIYDCEDRSHHIDLHREEKVKICSWRWELVSPLHDDISNHLASDEWFSTLEECEENAEKLKPSYTTWDGMGAPYLQLATICRTTLKPSIFEVACNITIEHLHQKFNYTLDCPRNVQQYNGKEKTPV